MLQAKKLPNKLWTEPVNTAAYVLNRTGPTSSDSTTLYEQWMGQQAPTEHLKIFGTECFVYVPKQKRRKLDAKAVKGHLVGYCSNKDGYRVYIPDNDDVIISRDEIFKGKETTSSDAVEHHNVTMDVDDAANHGELDVINEAIDELEEDVGDMVHDADRRVLRDRRNIKNPVRYEDYAMFADCDEPKSFSEAMKSANSLQWQQAMDDEMSSLVENKTWQLVEKSEGRKIVDNRWVYKVKLNTNGCVDKFKARLVAKGFSQEDGVDFNETYSPVARFCTIRAVLSVAASEKLNLVQFDVKTAVLYGELDEVIYMKQPAEYEDGTDRVCKLSRSLYGQAITTLLK